MVKMWSYVCAPFVKPSWLGGRTIFAFENFQSLEQNTRKDFTDNTTHSNCSVVIWVRYIPFLMKRGDDTFVPRVNTMA